jgi:hypothetical protein
MNHLAIIEGPEGAVVKRFATRQEAADFLSSFAKKNGLFGRLSYTLAEAEFTLGD